MPKSNIELELDGRTYRRYPESGRKNAQRYFTCTNGKGFRTYHRDLWKKHHGPIPKGHHVHHKDDNPLNNELSNLECLSPKEHAARHAGGEHSERSRRHINSVRHLASKWHKSDAGRQWHRENSKRIWAGRKKRLIGYCECCGKGIYTRNPTARKFCSNACWRYVKDRQRAYEKQVPCPVCSKTFWQSRYRKQPKTCSRVCGARLRRSS